MSKSWKSRGRGGLRRHIKMHRSRSASGRRIYKAKADPSGAFGRDGHAGPTPSNTAVESARQEAEVPNKAGPWMSMDALKNAVLKPGIEKHLEPLLLYRGQQSMGRIKMLWNHLQLMHLMSAGTSHEGVQLHQAEDVCQLLGPPAKLRKASLESFLSRMSDNLRVAENVPGLPEYLREELAFRKFNLARISAADRHSKMAFRAAAGQAEWDASEESRGRQASARRAAREVRAPRDVFYPYMIHDPGTDESELVCFINSVVPRGLSADIRADVCQETLLAILTGEIARDQAHSKRYEMMKRVLKMNGLSDRSLSLDTPMPGHSKTLGELLADSEWLEPWDERLDIESEAMEYAA